MINENPTLDILGFEFLEGTSNSTRATLEIDAGNMRFKFCMTSEQLELLALNPRSRCGLVERPTNESCEIAWNTYNSNACNYTVNFSPNAELVAMKAFCGRAWLRLVIGTAVAVPRGPRGDC